MLRGGRFGGKLCEAFQPNNSWGPSSIKERTDWQVVKMIMSMTTTMTTTLFKVYSETHSKLEFLPSRLRSKLEKDSAADEQQLPK